MKIPQDAKDTIVSNIKKGHPFGFVSFLSRSEKEIGKSLDDYINIPFNVAYEPPGIFKKEFLEYFIYVANHQVNSAVHPLTCGTNSNHELLVPRLDYQGNGYLICPTCGYVQQSSR
jgi:uncharacterized Zn-finger protein